MKIQLWIKARLIMLAFFAILGWFFYVFLFFGHKLGISVFLYYFGFVISSFVLLHKFIDYKKYIWWFALAISALLALTFFFFTNPVLRGLNSILVVLFSYASFLLFVGHHRVAWWKFSFLLDLFPLKQLVMYLTYFFSIFSKLFKWIESKPNPKFRKIFLGVLITIPLLFVVLALLSQADVMFDQFLWQIPVLIWAFFKNIDFNLRKVVVFFLLAMLLTSYWVVMWKKQKEMPEKETKDKKDRDNVIVSTVLVVMNLVYLLFVVIQIKYLLFGGALPEGMTYSEYAVRWFNELVIVTFINLSIFLAMSAYTKISWKKTSNWLLLVLFVLNILMMVSAFYKLNLYIDVYAYTMKRVMTMTVIPFLWILCLFALFRLFTSKISVVKSYILLSVWYYVFLNFFVMDAFIARQNVDRFISGETTIMDITYLTSLSYETTPALIDLYLYFQNSEDFHNKVYYEKTLYRHLSSLKFDIEWLSSTESDHIPSFQRYFESWRSYNLSASATKRLIEGNSS